MTDLSTAINAINASTADLKATIRHRGPRVDHVEMPMTIGGIECGTVEVAFTFERGERGFHGEGDPPQAAIVAVRMSSVDILPELKREDVKALEAEIVERAT